MPEPLYSPHAERALQHEAPPIPQSFGRYDIIGELARGGMGTVYLCRTAGEAGFARLFAVKVIHEHLAQEEAFISMLLDEARIASRLHHPNVVPVVDQGQAYGRRFLVMDYVEGCSLLQLCAKNPEDRPIELLIPLFIDALEGLHAAHCAEDEQGRALGLVHRDVSPENILVGVDGAARMIDFGIAKAEARITCTQPGMIKGKLAFMAPEQFGNDPSAIDKRSDIFALGVVLWSTLTGQHLFKGAAEATTVANVLRLKVRPPSAVGLRPPGWLDAICLRALERDPAKRFQSAGAMASALRQAAGEHGLLAARGQIARWVKSSFSLELAMRRLEIQEGSRSRVRAARADGPPLIPPLVPLASSEPEEDLSAIHTAIQALVDSSPPEATSVRSVRSVTPRFGSMGRALGYMVLLGILAASRGGGSDRDPGAADRLATPASATNPGRSIADATRAQQGQPLKAPTGPAASASASSATNTSPQLALRPPDAPNAGGAPATIWRLPRSPSRAVPQPKPAEPSFGLNPWQTDPR